MTWIGSFCLLFVATVVCLGPTHDTPSAFWLREEGSCSGFYSLCTCSLYMFPFSEKVLGLTARDLSGCGFHVPSKYCSFFPKTKNMHVTLNGRCWVQVSVRVRIRTRATVRAMFLACWWWISNFRQVKISPLCSLFIQISLCLRVNSGLGESTTCRLDKMVKTREAWVIQV